MEQFVEDTGPRRSALEPDPPQYRRQAGIAPQAVEPRVHLEEGERPVAPARTRIWRRSSVRGAKADEEPTFQ